MKLNNKEDSGKVFGNTKHFFHNPKETKKFLDYYFKDEEVKSKIILDAGCRVGDYSLGFVEKGAKEVHGVDLSAECVSVAEKKYAARNNMFFHYGNIKNLGLFPNNHFDITMCVGTIFYLKPLEIQSALTEFMRVTKPAGCVLVFFQKDKGFFTSLVRDIANLLPLRLYLFLVENFSFIMLPISRFLVGRKINLNYLKYDVLLSLRGLRFGVPVEIPEKFRIKNVTTEMCSEKTTTTYKIIVPKNKETLKFTLKK